MMNLETLTDFFMWSTLLNGGLLILWTGFTGFAPDLVFRTQTRWFHGSRETFDLVMYAFLGLYKIFFLTFSVIPYAVLLIIG